MLTAKTLEVPVRHFIKRERSGEINFPLLSYFNFNISFAKDNDSALISRIFMTRDGPQ